MTDFLALPPIGFKPDELSFYLVLSAPPFEWILKRGQGWVMLDLSLSFQDKQVRHFELTVGKYPTYPGYALDLRFQSDLLLTLGLVDGLRPYFGRVTQFLPTVGKEV